MAKAKAKAFPAEGGCTCRFIRYRMTAAPMFVHCCHCTWCQRESGASFALNALVETACLQVLSGKPKQVLTASNSGQGQKIVRCPKCHVALWSHYAGAGAKAAFVRVGTLDNPDLCPPDIHIFTESKQDWVQIPKGVPAVRAYYDREKEWPAASLKRRVAMMKEVNE